MHLATPPQGSTSSCCLCEAPLVRTWFPYHGFIEWKNTINSLYCRPKKMLLWSPTTKDIYNFTTALKLPATAAAKKRSSEGFGRLDRARKRDAVQTWTKIDLPNPDKTCKTSWSRQTTHKLRQNITMWWCSLMLRVSRSFVFLPSVCQSSVIASLTTWYVSQSFVVLRSFRRCFSTAAFWRVEAFTEWKILINIHQRTSVWFIEPVTLHQ